MRTYFLKSKRIGFSTWNNDDLTLATSLWGQPEVTYFICVNHHFTPKEIEDRLKLEIKYYNETGVQYFPIFNLETADLIGCCGLHPYEDEQAIFEIGIHIRKEYWQQGYAFEAAIAMIEHSFNVLKVKELKAGHNPSNTKSRNLLSKLGFKYEFDKYYKPTKLYHPTYSLKNPHK